MLQQPRVEGRHAHHRRGSGQLRHDVVRIEFRAEQHAAACQQQRVAGREQAMRVVDRECVKQHVRRPEPPDVDQRERVRGQVAMGQHGAFRTAGGAGGVEDGDEVVPPCDPVRRDLGLACRLREVAATERIQRPDAGHTMAATDVVHRAGRIGWTHDRLRLRVGYETLHFGQRVGRVQRHEHASRPGAGEDQPQHLRALLHLDDDPVAGRKSRRGQSRGEAARKFPELRVSEATPVGCLDERRLGRHHPVPDQSRQVAHRGIVEGEGHQSLPRQVQRFTGSAPRGSRSRW